MSTTIIRFAITLSLAIYLPFGSNAQEQQAQEQQEHGTGEIIPGVPFLTFSPDARCSALGETGVALGADGNAVYWNPAKLAYLDDENTLSASYSPWLKQLNADVSLSCLSFAHRMSERNVVAASLRYLNLGDVQLYDQNKNYNGNSRPFELAAGFSLARSYGKDFSLGLTMRYIYSLLSEQREVTLTSGNGAASFAADASFYARFPSTGPAHSRVLALGGVLSNIGPRITYPGSGTRYYLPTTLKVGVANTWSPGEDAEFSLALDLSKLLIPSQNNGNDDISVMSAMLRSFSSPGGMKEQFKEIGLSAGAELLLRQQLALRGGFTWEDPSRGSRRFISLGAGFKAKTVGIDFSYLMASLEKSPVANTVRISASYSFGGKRDRDQKL